MAHDRSRSLGSVSSGSETPRLATIDSLTPLILTPDEQNQSPSPFQFPDDEEAAHELEQDDEEHSQMLRKAAVPLPPTTVSLYLLSPYTKLGALLLLHLRLPLKHAIPLLFGFALLSLIARYLWCMLARYLRKYNFEDVVSHTFAGGRGRERERDLLRIAIRSGTAALRAILAAVYLRFSTSLLAPFLPETVLAVPTCIVLSIFAVLCILPLSLSQTLASRRVVCATWLSILAYVAWLGCISYAYATDNLDLDAGLVGTGKLWQGAGLVAFIFTFSSTLSLYASLNASQQSIRISTRKTPRTRSFRALSILSVFVALVLTFPLLFFTPPPSRSTPGSGRLSRSLPPPLLPTLASVTLLLSLPSLLVLPTSAFPASPSNPPSFPAFQIFLSLVVLALSVLPDVGACVLMDILLAAAFIATYFLPALMHVTIHNFKRPLSLIMPSRTPSNGPPPTSSTYTNTNGHHTEDNGNSESSGSPLLPRGSPIPLSDELLRRKEAALQWKQWKKRLVWDIAAWVLVGPVSFLAVAWAVGVLVTDQ